MDLAHEPALKLGRIDVRPSTREVAYPGGGEIVEPRVMAVLVVLAKAAGAVVTRDELVDACWDGRIVSDDAINRVISRVRRISELTDGRDFTIETITKVGYRLRVGEGSADHAVAPAGAAEPAPGVGLKLDRRVLIGAGVAAVAGIGGALVWRFTRPAAPSHAEELYRRAVEIGVSDDPAQVAQSISFLREAVSLAPGYADAWAALALAYINAFQTNPPERYASLAERAREAANRALALDAGHADAMAALALMPPVYQRWGEAERSYRAALARKPRLAPVDNALAEVLSATGRFAEAVSPAEKALAQSSLIARRHYDMAIVYWYAGRLDAADRTIDKARDLWPLDISIWFGRLYLTMHTGNVAGALAMLADRAGRPTGVPEGDFQLVEAAARAMQSGAAADRTAAIDANMAAARNGLGYARNAVIVASVLGGLDAADEAANAYFFDKPFAVAATYFSREQGEYRGVRSRETQFLFAPQLGGYRADPRFARLVEAVGLEGYWREAGVTPDYRKAR